MSALGTNVILGLIAGITIYIGLAVARWRNMPEAIRGIFALASAGILIYLAIEVGYHAFEAVETPFKLGKNAAGFASLGLVIAGLAIGMVSLGAWEDRQRARKEAGLAPAELALMTAWGIGVHNFGEGLAIGQSYASGATALGASLVAGFALHNATEGFGIVGALRGERASLGRVALLGLIGGGPTVVGSVIGGVWTNAMLVTFCFALAAGSLLFVVRELVRIPFKLPARASLGAVAAGLMLGLVSEVAMEAVQSTPAGAVPTGTAVVDLRITAGKFSPASLDIPAGAALRIKNEDNTVYTLEGAGILPGDVPVDANSTRTVRPFKEPGTYTIFAEENQRLTVPVRVTGGTPVVVATPKAVEDSWRLGRQPVIFSEEQPDPAYVAYSAFNLSTNGERVRDSVIADLRRISQEIVSDRLPDEFAQYFKPSEWIRLRPTVAMVYGLGAPAFDSKRFGETIAKSKPAGLKEIDFCNILNFDAKKSQKDVIVRVTSDSLWFNQQICRYVWDRLGGRIKDANLDYGYANPNGRSPILGGFFDGTGNPIGHEREQAVFGKDARGEETYLTWFRIRFDQERFKQHTLAEQQAIIGRVKSNGLQLPNDHENSHRSKAEGDSSRTIYRQGYVYDYGPGKTGLLFASAQTSLKDQFEGILCGYMINASAPRPGAGKDRLIDYMHFEEGGYYYVPPATDIAPNSVAASVGGRVSRRAAPLNSRSAAAR